MPYHPSFISIRQETPFPLCKFIRLLILSYAFYNHRTTSISGRRSLNTWMVSLICWSISVSISPKAIPFFRFPDDRRHSPRDREAPSFPRTPFSLKFRLGWRRTDRSGSPPLLPVPKASNGKDAPSARRWTKNKSVFPSRDRTAHKLGKADIITNSHGAGNVIQCKGNHMVSAFWNTSVHGHRKTREPCRNSIASVLPFKTKERLYTSSPQRTAAEPPATFTWCFLAKEDKKARPLSTFISNWFQFAGNIKPRVPRFRKDKNIRISPSIACSINSLAGNLFPHRQEPPAFV